MPRFDTPCPCCVGYTISMCGLKTNGTCVGSGSLSSTFGLVVPLSLPNCTLGLGTITAHVSPLFFSKKKKKKILQILTKKTHFKPTCLCIIWYIRFIDTIRYDSWALTICSYDTKLFVHDTILTTIIKWMTISLRQNSKKEMHARMQRRQTHHIKKREFP